MRIVSHDIVFQEVPDNISLSIYVKGCQIYCEGCHSPQLWDNTSSEFYILDETLLKDLIFKYSNMITCVLFMGGEWYPDKLLKFLQLIQKLGLKTALYTGEDTVSSALMEHLDFIKTGKYYSNLGGLSSSTTNQMFLDVKNNKILNDMFRE